MSATIHRRRSHAEKAELGARIRTSASAMSGKFTAGQLADTHRTTKDFVRIHAGPHLKRVRKP